MRSVLDHLVLAGASLQRGAPPLQRVLGTELAGGGQHARMGTHNRLLRVGEGVYLNLLGLPCRCAPAAVPRLTAHLRTPSGPRTLRSTEPIQ